MHRRRGLQRQALSLSQTLPWPPSSASEAAESEFALALEHHGLFPLPFPRCFRRLKRRLTHVRKAGQQAQNIQALLEAEKEAAKVVQQARQCPYPYS